MKTKNFFQLCLWSFFCWATSFLVAEDASINQTSEISPIHNGDHLPFEVEIALADFSLPDGFHSGAFAVHKGKWLFLAGRINGLHGFNNNPDNFPPQKQNTNVYVIDPLAKTVAVRSLHHKHSGLSSSQIDLLAVTSPQFYQEGNTLYMTGGYGIDTKTMTFTTKDVLTAIDVPGLMHWVTEPSHKKHQAQRSIRQISNPLFQVTGGYMTRMGKHATLLVFGQDFEGYYLPQNSGTYTQQVRRFRIIDDGVFLGIEEEEAKPPVGDPLYRRRDLNILPCIKMHKGKTEPYLAAFSGVFTLAGGAWTVPVTITPTGRPSMRNPSHKTTFKQGMNNYVCATAGLFSEKHQNMYNLFFGGISFEYYDDGSFATDPALPFINQVTTIARQSNGHFKQYLMDASYPYIESTASNPGNQLLFGAGADFIPAEGLQAYSNGVIKLDALGKHHTLLGYIVGGIQSTVPNTTTISDSSASPYIFKVLLKNKK